MSISVHIDYKSSKSELCEIGKKHDTDKSSQRADTKPGRHSHPYTLFYHNLFENKKDDNLEIAEIGVYRGASMLMWREYFKNSNLYGFDNNEKFLESLRSKEKAA